MSYSTLVPNYHRSSGSAQSFPWAMVRRNENLGPRQVAAATVAELKTWLRVDHSQDDALITTLIEAATDQLEGYTNRTFLTRLKRLTLDYSPWGEDAIYFPDEPLQTVEEFRYYGDDGSFTVWASSNYSVFTESSRLVTKEGVSFPTGGRRGARIEIDYLAGYAAGYGSPISSNVKQLPDGLKQAVIIQAAFMYENRDSDAAMPSVVKQLCSPHRRHHIF